MRSPRALAALFGLSLIGLIVGSASTARAFSNLIVLGDSIVDQGNTQAAAIANGFGDPAPAAFGYFQGRFTNGINPADVVNQAVEGTNSTGSLFGGDNFAFGGARARDNGDFLPDLVGQTIQFTTRPRPGGGPVDPDTLVMINIGGNDVRDIVIGNLSGAARQSVIDAAAAAVATSISFLQSVGVQHILFVGVGNVGGIPEIGALGAPAAAVGRQASLDMNAAIQAVLPVGATFFDTIAWADNVLANPGLFGLPTGLNTSVACLLSGAPAPGGAPTCNDYAYFDSVHPTTQVLQLLGQQLVTVVPEPGTAILLMGGLAALSAGRPRREA